jgi:hypothetical protein
VTASIPVNLVEIWITELQDILKATSQDAETPAELWVNIGMRDGISQIGGKLTTWLRHQQNMETLNRSGKHLLITKDVNLSDGRYRKLEWYQGNHFVVVAWLHGMDEEFGELMLDIQQVEDLSKTFLVYRGSFGFEDLAELARVVGLDSIRNEGNRRQWVEKVWP